MIRLIRCLAAACAVLVFVPAIVFADDTTPKRAPGSIELPPEEPIRLVPYSQGEFASFPTKKAYLDQVQKGQISLDDSLVAK